MPFASKLSRFAVSSSKVASLWDWNKAKASIMALSINTNMVGISISRHPCHENDFYPSESESESGLSSRIRIRTDDYTDEELVNTLSTMVEEHKVCAFLVHWPVSTNGRMGEACGRTLYRLDKLVNVPISISQHEYDAYAAQNNNSTSLTSKSSLIAKNRPFALINKDAVSQLDLEDQWGRVGNFVGKPLLLPGHGHGHGHPVPVPVKARSVIYSSKTYLSSEKASSADQDAVEVLSHFVKEQWPETEEIQTKKDHNGGGGDDDGTTISVSMWNADDELYSAHL
eukprot:154129_1